ncbi:TIGR01212 family radical SAM protein [Thermosulfuriphilus sp.]
MKAGPQRLENLKRYHSLGLYFRKRYGERVHKIALDAGFSCPNRDGTKGLKGCLYCDIRGSGTGALAKGIGLEEQVLSGIDFLTKRFKARKFMVYFQSFSNTYAPIERLKDIYDRSLIDERIVGLSVGTRPDCVDKKVIELLASYRDQGLEVWLELGLQSIHEETLKRINRGHGVTDFFRALEMAKGAGLLVCVHVIFGLPGEDETMMLATIEHLAEAPIDGIKFHVLYVVKGAGIEGPYLRGDYRPLGLSQYVDLVCESLAILPWQVVIQRLVSDPPQKELLAPEWSLKKRSVLSAIEDTLISRDLWQGKRRGEKWPQNT